MVKLRKSKLDDIEFIFNLRNKKYVRKNCLSNDLIKWSTHVNFYQKNMDQYNIIESKGLPIGFIRKDKSNYISIAIIKTMHNKGIAKQILKNIQGNAIIKLNNEASLNAFLGSGYKLKGFYLENDRRI